MATFDFAVIIGDQHFDRGAEVPAELAEKITNPKIVPQDQDGHPVDADSDKPPAKNAKTEVWAAYAAKTGVVVPADAKKADIVAAVEAARTPAPDGKGAGDGDSTGGDAGDGGTAETQQA